MMDKLDKYLIYHICEFLCYIDILCLKNTSKSLRNIIKKRYNDEKFMRQNLDRSLENHGDKLLEYMSTDGLVLTGRILPFWLLNIKEDLYITRYSKLNQFIVSNEHLRLIKYNSTSIFDNDYTYKIEGYEIKSTTRRNHDETLSIEYRNGRLYMSKQTINALISRKLSINYKHYYDKYGFSNIPHDMKYCEKLGIKLKITNV